MQITITSPEWTIDEMTKGWADDDSLTAEQTRDLADAEYAWLVVHTHEHINGWRYENGTFTGEARNDILGKIMALLVVSSDWVIDHLDEILAEDEDSQAA